MKDKVGASLHGAPKVRHTVPHARNPPASLHGAARRGTDAERRCHDGGDRIGMVIVCMHDCWQRKLSGTYLNMVHPTRVGSEIGPSRMTHSPTRPPHAHGV